MADDGIEIPVSLDIDDAEKELAKLQKKISRTKISLDLAIGNKEEYMKAYAAISAEADAVQEKMNSGEYSEGAGSVMLAEISKRWTLIEKQIREAEADERRYRAVIASCTTEYGKLSQIIAQANMQENKGVGAMEALRNLAEEFAVPMFKLQGVLYQTESKLREMGNGSALSGLVSMLGSGVSSAFDAAKAKASALGEKVKELGQEQYVGKRVAPTSFMDSITSGIESAKAKLSSLGQSVSDVLNQAGDGNRFAGVFVMAQTAILNAEKAIKGIGQKFTEATNAAGIFKASLGVALIPIKLLGKGAKELGKLTLKGLLNGLKAVGSAAKKAATSLGRMALNGIKKGLSSLGKTVGGLAKKMLGLGDSAKKSNGGFLTGIGTVLKYALSIRSLYMLVRKLKSALVEGFKNLAQFSTQTNSDISMVMSALTQLKNSLATAFAPILTVVAPLITNFINMMSSAATAVARLTAALTGKTSFVKATAVQQDYASSLDSTASSAGDAAEAAQEASKTLAGFDEINKLDAPSSSSGGGGSGGGSGGSGTGDMFTTEEIEPLSFDSWGAAFSAFLDTLLNDGIPMLKNALSNLAEWINTFAGNVAEMFTFPGVLEKVQTLGQEIAKAFNDFVNQIDWATIGTGLGAGFNLALQFLTNLIYTFDWLNLGAQIANLVNSAVEQVDWTGLGQLLWSKFKIAIETLAGFLLNLDMANLALAASNIAIGFFDSITDTIASIDWIQLGHQVATFLENVDWAGVATSCFTAIGAAFGAAAAFLWGFIEDAFDAIYEWWHENVTEGGLSIAEGLLLGISNGLLGIFNWIDQNVFQPIWNGIKKAFGIASPSKKMKELGGFMAEGLLQGVKERINAIIQTFQGLWQSIKEVFGNVTGWFSGKFSDAWQAVKDVFSSGGEVFEGIKEGILSGLKAVVNALIRGINRVIAVPFNGLNSALRTIRNVSILGLRPFSWISTISVPSIPQLAQGAVIPPNKEFLAVLGDQKNGTNIETPLSTMVQAFKQAMSESGTGDVYIYLDSQQIAARVEKRQKQRAIRTNGAVKSYV